MARKAIGLVFAGMVVATAAHAEGYADSIVAQLRSQGFSQIETEQTWLGRTKIVASGSDGRREIVVNPNTGEILRDLWLTRDSGSGGGLVSSGGRDDDGDDRDDGNSNDGNDDNGGNSGSSGGGGGSGGSSGGGSGGGGSGGGDNGGDSD